MLSSEALKKIVTEARPIIERQLNDALLLAGLRDAVAVEGGDWGQLKALIKAQIQDENDDAGDGKRVRKILDKAEYANAYADMLGLAKMNENNFSGDVTIVDRIDTDGNRLTVTVDARVAEILARNSGPPHDPETGEITESDLAETRPDGRGKAESASGEAPDTAPQQIQESTEQPSAAAEVTTPDANTHGQTGTADNSGLAASVPANAEAVAKKVGQSEQEAAIELPVDTSAPAVLRAERHNDDPRCLDKAKCGAMSNFAFCMKCRGAWREQHPGEVAA